MSFDHSKSQHVTSNLMRESLVDKNVIARTEAPVTSILPDVNIIQIGGHSIMDKGRSALLPLLDEIVVNQAEHRMIIGVGAGVRS
ncbi:MAG TPA: uridine kinase, partial [Candidatus Angelobacter sp.]|nr:uridine kinase [Candidatus Angelobacter sp.]